MDRFSRILKQAQSLGAEYADLRYIEMKSNKLGLKNKVINLLTEEESNGIGLRVRVKGAWGFAGISVDHLNEVDELALINEALSLAKAASKVQKQQKELAATEVYESTYRVKVVEDPFRVPLKEKIDLLQNALTAMAKNSQVVLCEGNIEHRWERKIFYSSEGSKLEQEFYITGGGIAALASDGKERQSRSYPMTFGGNYAQKGFEFIRAMQLKKEAQRVGEEASALLTAPQCPSGNMTLILGGSQLALQIHESCGHPIELDRVLGTEAGLAGTSFLTTDNLNKLRYGSEKVNLTADATIEGALGSFAFDDEGSKAQRIEIVKNGIFKNYLTSRESAPFIGANSNGTMRAMGWQYLPLVRMTNINLEPGEESLQQLISGTENGVWMDNIKSWSIDDKRINFQFGTELGWLIKNGEIKGLVKNPTYTGSTVAFWNSCDGVASADEWQLWGVPNCGKGEPVQAATVGHGNSYARFRDVKVGVGKW